ncbi:MAG TPA: BlaI/MecI/CopY family transcriptional regulator [Hyphomonadaceae bacterium]|jgi:predicted transcriptional regulator|nr:BlaI/MecI/CopY family transcriptional regulator [Hyphomonadaceae bacterium]
MQISEAESRIMEALWKKAPLTGDQIVAQVASKNDWAAGTVRTLITRLLRKKAIAGAKEGEAYVYRPLIARSVWVSMESQGLLDKLFKGEVAPLVAHFAEHRQLSAKDIKQLKSLIDALEAPKANSPKKSKRGDEADE